MTTPRRRWTFSLRAMLGIVAVAAIVMTWLQGQAQIVRERAAELAKLTDGDSFYSQEYIERHKAEWEMCGLGDDLPPDTSPKSELQLAQIREARKWIRQRELAAVPWWRKLLGDQQIDTIYTNSRSVERLTRLFPEASITVDDDILP